jgi:hypothetical protein
MAITIQGEGDVWKVEIRERGPARITVKVAPTKGKEEGAVWKSTFLDLSVWGNADKDGNRTPGAEMIHDLQQKDKIRFEARGKTDVWADKQTGKERAALGWTVTRLELVSRANDPRAPASSDDIPF